MSDQETDLIEAFREEHVTLAESFGELASRLQEGDWTGALATADRIDEVAGLLIRFEEDDLYPLLLKVLGESRVVDLYHDHGPGLAVVRALLVTREGGFLPEARRLELLGQARAMVRHVTECVDLAGVFGQLPERDRDHLARRLDRYRAEPVGWSEWMRQRERREIRSSDY